MALQFGISGLMALFSRHFFLSPYPLIVFILGGLLGIWALQHNQLGNFNVQPKLKENAQLVTTGIYGYIRHPMYLSVTIMMLSMVIASPTLLEILLFMGLIIVLWLKARREEALWSLHDEAYKIYRKRSKFFLPFVL